jgi:hypothetical protein
MKGIAHYVPHVCVSHHKSNYVSFIQYGVRYCIVHPFIFCLFYSLPLVRRIFLVEYIVGSTVIKLCEQGTLFLWTFLLIFCFQFISFPCNWG